MKQNYKIKILFFGCAIFGFFCLTFLIRPLPALAGTGNVTVGNPCVSIVLEDNCGQGLNCVNGYCVDPNATTNPANPTTPGNPNPTNQTPPTSGSACPTGLTMTSAGLCLPPNEYKTGIASKTTLTDFILELVKILLSFAGVIAVVMLVIGGYWYMAAGGNEEMSEKGKKTIINFVLGLVVVILAYTIVTVIASTLTGGDKLVQ
jgi:hypothetical protein